MPELRTRAVRVRQWLRFVPVINGYNLDELNYLQMERLGQRPEAPTGEYAGETRWDQSTAQLVRTAAILRGEGAPDAR